MPVFDFVDPNLSRVVGYFDFVGTALISRSQHIKSTSLNLWPTTYQETTLDFMPNDTHLTYRQHLISWPQSSKCVPMTASILCTYRYAMSHCDMIRCYDTMLC